MGKQYEEMTKEELIEECRRKDIAISECMDRANNNATKIYGKTDIMSMYKCESNKALRMLKLLFQMGYANKIGKEYYLSSDNHKTFMRSFAGKEVFI